ncbi:hypothetical protein KP79_PYT04408 [Mizuhopecten yessoensis]|uniref:Uncharacterized protein n=1 Tax=Mizuhopecten yessoensis TaxID=6573 RepID=A0A210R0X6_MIZYE|nr:hypothetical protein KP79_PYT04408 [Mizuhopecten yessoensis]
MHPSVGQDPVAGDPTTQDSGISLTHSQTQCTLSANDPDIHKTLRLLLDKGDNLVVVQLSSANKTAWKVGDGDIFDPYTWMRISSRKGRGMLWLREEFEMLSLTTLTYGVSKLNVEITESIPGCIANQTMLSKLAESFLFNDFRISNSSDSTWRPKEELCNRRLRDTPNGARIYYVCCHQDEKGKVLCAELTHDIWITILLACVVLINLVVILYLPLVVPPHLYRVSRGFIHYQHKLATAIKFRIMKTQHPPDPSNNQTNVLHKSALKELPNLRKLIDDLDEDKTYELPLGTINFLVQRARLIPGNYVPVGIGKTLYDTILRCKISKRTSLQKCCKSKLFGPLPTHKWNLSWYKCLQTCMDLVILVVIVCPWIIRVIIYLLFEHKNHMLYQHAAMSRGLAVGFRGSFALLLNPLHPIFLVCYGLIIVDSVLIGFLKETITDNFVFVLKKCFRDMRDRSPMRAIGWSTMILMKPCEKCGILALFLAPVYWLLTMPFVICILFVYLFPTINLTVRFIIHLFISVLPSKKSQDKHASSAFTRTFSDFFETDFLSSKETFQIPGHQTLRRRSAQVLILMVCLITMYSTIFLVTECITFFVEVAVYTVIGVILNAGHTMQYVSLIFMLFLYGKDCFGSVSAKYLVFNKTILSTVMAKSEDEVKKVSWQSEDQQGNTAFQLKSEIPEAPGSFSEPIAHSKSAYTDRPVVVVKDGHLKWKIKRLVMFLDKKDTPYITQKFFFDTSKMPCSGSPGPLLNNLCGAISGFLVIIVFLLFVMLVVITFGDMYEVNSSNQTLATLAGGFLPWVFRNVLFKSAADLTVDTDNLHFQGCFANVIERYVQTWPFADIEEDTKRQEGLGKQEAVEMHEVEERSLLPKGPTVVDKDDVLPAASLISHDERNLTLPIPERWLSRVHEVSEIPSNELDLIIDVSKQKKRDYFV